MERLRGYVEGRMGNSQTVREDFSKTSIFEAYIESKQEAAMPANEGGVV